MSGCDGYAGACPIKIEIPRTEDRSTMLKSYTAYIIQVDDFGRRFEVERRFDDFQKLRTDLSEVDRGLPALPEKKMFASTDATVVAERKPAFEALLQYMLQSEEVCFEQNQFVWKFLELSVPSMVATRYLFKRRHMGYIQQLGKLVGPKYEKEHAYRLCNEEIVRTNVRLISDDSLHQAAAKAASGGVTEKNELEAEAAAAEGGEDSAEATAAKPGKALTAVELEYSVLEMLRYSVSQGGAAVRKVFLEEDGLTVMLSLILRVAQREGASSSGPDQRVRNVLNGLIYGEGDQFPSVFSSFLRKGGVTVLSGYQKLCGSNATFAEFIGKLLWLAWDVDVQRAFLESDVTSGAESLAILSALFGSGTKTAQILAGLLLSSLVANGLFANDSERERKAAGGVDNLVEELVVTLPVLPSPPSASSTAGNSGAKQQSKDASGEDVHAAEAFLASISRSDRSFHGALTGALAPLQGDGEEMHVAHGDSPVWSACAFSLWCLLKVHPKAARLVKLRPMLPVYAQTGPPRTRWLAGELLLQLHVAGDSKEGRAGSGGSTSGGAAAEPDVAQLGVEAISKEQTAVESTMGEQLGHALGQVRSSLEQGIHEAQQQRHLLDARKQSLALAPGSGGCGVELDAALKRLADVRERQTKAVAVTEEQEERSTKSLDSLSRSISEEAGATGGSEQEMQDALRGVLEVESEHRGKQQELAELDEALATQNSTVLQCSNAMEEGDRKVAACRKMITGMEAELSTKQRNAQQQRMLASSDVSVSKGRITGDMEDIDKRLLALRDRAQAAQDNPDTVEDVMAQLKQEAAKLKQRKAELAAELQKIDVDPASAQDSAMRLEREAGELQMQLQGIRTGELVDLENAHAGSREAWQRETSRLQEVRSMRDSAERAKGELQRQLAERWKRWRPLWSARLARWRERAAALSEAQVCARRFEEGVSANWEQLREEQEARRDVLQAIARAQDVLGLLAQQISEIEDLR